MSDAKPPVVERVPERAPTQDPTLAALVPERSSVRNIAVVLLVVAAIGVSVWWGGASRLDVRGSAGGAELTDDGRIITAIRVDGAVAPGTRAVAVTAPEGTRVGALWLLGADDPDPLGDGTSLEDAVAAMVASDAPSTLPARVPTSGLSVLVVLVVEDCSLLADDAASPAATGSLEVRSLLGESASIDLEAFTWPRADLAAAGACAEPS